VAGGQVDVGDLADLRQLPHRWQSLLDPPTQHLAGELGRDDGDGHVVAALIGELLRVAGEVPRRRDRALAEGPASLVVEVGEVRLLEVRPVGQRDLAVLDPELVGDGVAVAGREAADVDRPGDAVGPRVHRGVGDAAPGGVRHEHHPAVGAAGVDRADDRVDVVAQGGPRAVGVLRLHARQRERVRAVPRPLEGRDDLLPR
jgi:hypothetical protein